jgi:hypothetical protein
MTPQDDMDDPQSRLGKDQSVLSPAARARRRFSRVLIPETWEGTSSWTWSLAVSILLAVAIWCLYPDLVARGVLLLEETMRGPLTASTSSAPAEDENVHAASTGTPSPTTSLPVPSPSGSTREAGRVAASAAPSPWASSSEPTSTTEPSTSPRSQEAAAGAGAPSQELPADVLAGPVGDDVLQQLLQQSMPSALTVSGESAQQAGDVAWAALEDDLLAGGWSGPHRQALVFTATGTSQATTEAGSVSSSTQLPIVVDAHIMWSATAPSGDLDDRQLAVVRLQRGGGSWVAQLRDSAGS